MFEEKIKWLREWTDKHHNHIDVLNADLVDAYIERFNVKHKFTTIGAFKCPDLSRTLSKGFKDGILKRESVGVSGAPWGFPKWVYVYNF